ncbi:MAG: AbrB/MazE/SpoVT family DNA-binding domain-containing protein [Planctomycetes bacterium]|nr:AbrB/MazE/SpoVT family DNA-binding domain-containing protein [Planctomycetota bacterium]
MIKTLSRHGNSLALIIDRPILDLLNIDEKTPLSITTDGKRLVIARAPDAEREKRFQAALEEVNRKHGKALKRLAE